MYRQEHIKLDNLDFPPFVLTKDLQIKYTKLVNVKDINDYKLFSLRRTIFTKENYTPEVFTFKIYFNYNRNKK